MKKETRPIGRVALVTLLAAAFVYPTTGAYSAGPGGWGHVGGGTAEELNGAPYTWEPGQGVLYVGGNFADAGGDPDADYIATWNGQAWGSIGPAGLNGSVFALARDNGNVYAGGQFTNAGGDPNADHLAVWDGVTWAPACTAVGPALNGNVEALEIIGSRLYVGGSFQNGAGIASADYLLACDLATGVASSTVTDPTHPISGSVLTLDSDSAGNLFVGGRFNNVEDIAAADNVAALDPTGGWHALGDSGINDFVRALTVGEDGVYVTTDGLNIAGIPQADHIARWNGSFWSALGSDTAGDNGWFSTLTSINDVITLDDLVFVTGSFQDANGDPLADNVAYFDGTEWDNVGSNGAGDGPWIGSGHSLVAFDDTLFAGGGFLVAGGDPDAVNVASFDLLGVTGRIGLAARGGAPGSSTLGQGPSKTISVRRGRTGTFFLNFENSGLINMSLGFDGSGSARGYTVKYFDGVNGDVTKFVKAGTYTAGRSLDPGAHRTLKMTVKLSANAAAKGTFVTKARTGSASATVTGIVKAK